MRQTAAKKSNPKSQRRRKPKPPAAPEVSNLRITPAPAPLDFRNPIAVRIALTMATITTLLSWMPLLNIALWVASGFFAVYFYRRRTGDLLTVRNGMRMGWITGVLTFAITTLVFTATMIPMAFSGGLGTLFRNQFKNFPIAGSEYGAGLAHDTKSTRHGCRPACDFGDAVRIYHEPRDGRRRSWHENDWPSQRLNHAFGGFPSTDALQAVELHQRDSPENHNHCHGFAQAEWLPVE